MLFQRINSKSYQMYFEQQKVCPGDIPLAAPVHIQAHVHSTTSQYEFLGNINKDIEKELSSFYRKSFDDL